MHEEHAHSSMTPRNEYKNRDVLLIVPRDDWVGVVSGNLPSRGVACLAASVEKNGHTVQVVDGNTYPLHDRSIKKLISRVAPKVVGITSATCNSHEAHRIARVIKDKDASICIVAGGPHFSYEYEEALVNAFDVVVHFEGDFSFPKVVECVKIGKSMSNIKGITHKEKGRILRNTPCSRITDLNKLPAPAWHQFDMNKYWLWLNSPKVLSLHTSRGCNYNCKFCTLSSYWGRNRQLAPEKIAQEIKIMQQRYKVQIIAFTDTDLMANPQYFSRICELISQTEPKIKWFFKARCTSVIENPTLIQKAKRCGAFFVMMGGESYSNRRLAKMNKNMTISDVRKASNIIRANRCLLWLTFVSGMPSDTKKDLSLLYQFAVSLNPDLFTVLPVTPLPGNRYWSECSFSADRYQELDTTMPAFSTSDLGREQMKRAITKMYLRYYVRPTYAKLFLEKNQLQRKMLSSVFRQSLRIFCSRHIYRYNGIRNGSPEIQV
jgi:radical SAM superfamily enzyme YgiQ (UPF0313 family)